MRVNVAREHVFWLHETQRLGIAHIGRAGAFGCGKLRAHVAGQIGVSVSSQ
jgi:hypothetical protein